LLEILLKTTTCAAIEQVPHVTLRDGERTHA